MKRPYCNAFHFSVKMIRLYIQSGDTSFNGKRITRILGVGWICPSCHKVMIEEGDFKKEDSMITDKKHRTFKRAK